MINDKDDVRNAITKIQMVDGDNFIIYHLSFIIQPCRGAND